MVDVTGRIGSEQVELNNAATEATLRLLLTATLSANKQNHDDIAKMAKQAGLDPASVAAANDNLDKVAATGKKTEGVFYTLGVGTGVAVEGFKKLDTALSPLISQLLSGTDKASSVFTELGKFSGPLSGVFNGFARLAKFQEDGLESYQKMSGAGVAFGGSLTDMRTAAASTYMTLDQFTNVMKNNSEAFAKMGGTAEQGAKAFTNLSSSLQKSEAGSELRALGYTSEQVNEGLAQYLTNTGARTKQEMQNTTAITKGAGEYLTQLDGLAAITGKSREEQEKSLKQANANAAYEQMKMGMTEEQRSAYDKGLAEMSAKFGKAGEELFKSQAMGLPPMTEAAQKLQALAPEVAAASQGMADVGKRGGTAAETFKLSAQASEGSVKAAERYTQVAGALSFSTDSTSQAMMGLTKESTRARAAGAETTEKAQQQQREVAEEQKKRKESEAKAAVDTQKAVQELGQTVLAALLPAIKLLTPIMNTVVSVFGAIVKAMNEYKTVTIALAAAAAAYLVIQKTQQILDAVKAAKSAGGRGPLGGLGVLGALAGGKVAGPLGSSPDNPMWVKIVGGGGGGLEDLLDGGKKGKPTAKPAGGKGVPANRAARLAKVAEGRAAQAASAGGAGKAASAMKGLKGAGVVGALAGIVSAGSDIIDINAKLKAGEISKEEASKQKGGVAGEAAGGAAGGWGGAAAGAALGTMLLPGIGTIVGGLIGGAMGAYGGGMAGKAVGEGVMGPGDTPKTSAPKPKLADGGIVSKPTNVLAGESGAEVIAPVKYFENLQSELQTLNKQTVDMLRYLRETAEYTRSTADATKQLGGDLFKF